LIAGARTDEERRTLLEPALRLQFRPEFLNRLDEVVIFHALTEPEIEAIVDLQLAQVTARLEDRRIHLSATPAARTLLASAGFDPTFGARPLKRTIQRMVVDPLTAKLLAGEVRDGSEVKVDAREGEIVLSMAAPKAGGKGA
jgi:ATP-dependent Clp protease ATP-binding subunit ClpA